MPSHDYHPLRLRAVLPGSAHLGDLEARASARTSRERNASDVEAYLAEIRHLLEGRALARGERPTPEFIRRSAADEALRISKALQWARSAPRVVRVPSAGPPGGPDRGTLRVGGIRLPAPCIYVAFSDDFPTPDADVRIAGAYLGEGGSLEALVSGWVEYVWALAVAVQRTGEPLGSATASWHASIPTADPARRVSEVLVEGFRGEAATAAAVHFGSPSIPPPAWHAHLADAVECALLAAAQSCVAHVVTAPRRRPSLPDASDAMDAGGDEDRVDEPDAPAVVHEASVGPRSAAEVVFGPASPRARNRWLVEREPPATAAAPDRPNASVRSAGGVRRKVSGHDRSPHSRVYHRDTSREFSTWVAGHPVNGGRSKDPASTVIVDRLDPGRGSAPSPS